MEKINEARARGRMGATTVEDELGLGRVISLALAVVGITPERVTSWLGRPCGCSERKEKLDSLYFWARRVAGSGGTRTGSSGGHVARTAVLRTADAEFLGVIMEDG